MEILLTLDNYEERFCNDSLELSEEEKDNIKKEVDLGSLSNVDFVNIGPGADWIVILLILNIGLQIIKVGAEINDGIDGWIGLGKKLLKLFRRNKIVSIDEDGATALAINLIAKKEKIDRLEKIQEATINLADLSGIIRGNKGLSNKPHNYYIQTYCINNNDVYVIGVKSSGKAEIIKHFCYDLNGLVEIK